MVISIEVTGPKVLVKLDLYDHTETPLTHVPIGPAAIEFLVEIVEGASGNLFNLRWLPGNRAEPGKGPIL